jgi:methyl-accepting chemotaxis protein
MKLRSKFLLTVLLPMVAVLYGVLGWNLWRSYHELMDNQLRSIELKLEDAAARVDSSNREAVTVARVMALAQENGLFGHREQSLQFAQAVLEEYPQFIGSYFGYEPNADGEDATFLATHPYRPDGATDASGRFLPYWVRINGKITLEPLEQMENPDSLYYRQMKANYLARGDKYLITEPYLYKDGNYIVEQTSPIVINNQFEGIAGVDRGLDSISEILHDLEASLAPLQTANFIVVSGGNRVVAATLPSQDPTQGLRSVPVELLYVNVQGQFETSFLGTDSVGKSILRPGAPNPASDPNLDGTYARLLGQMLQNRDQFHPFDTPFFDPVRQQLSYIASAPVRTGNWMLVLTVTRDELMLPVRSRIVFSIATSSGGILLVAFMFVVAVNSISRRIGRAVTVAQQVAAGDLTADVHVDCRDETGQLLRANRDMIGSLNSLIGQVKRSSIQLISTANEISGTAKMQETTVQDFGSSTNQIAAAVKEISATSQELLGAMAGVSTVASDTAGLADTGRQQLADMKSKMQSLAGATTSISQKLTAITEKAQAITGVITAITKVADQTNLLSLNAAIEAEKAGEYGLGFGVVAREIRRLADQTAVSVLDIENMVRDMQTAVSAGVMEMDKFTGEVRIGVDEVGRLGQHLETILHQVQALLPRFGQVKEGMTAQSAGAQQINEAMTGLTEGARQTAESRQEFDKAVRNLHAAVEALRREIARFKVAEGGTGLTRLPFPASPKKPS